MSGWQDFFMAEAGAAAALAGLLFLSVSINVKAIRAAPALPPRALESVVLSSVVLFVAILGLVPARTEIAFGLEITGLGGLAACWEIWAVRVAARRDERDGARARRAARFVVAMTPATLFMIAGAALTCGRAWGMLVLTAGTLVAFAVSLLGAWTLLMEVP